MKEQIIKLLKNRKVNTLDPFCRCFRSSWLSEELKTSKYLTLKSLNVLKNEGLVSYGSFGGGCMCSINESTPFCECDGGLPFWAWEWQGELLNQCAM